MATNPTPEDDDILRALAEDLADGLHTHEVTLGIKQNTEAKMRADIATVATAETQLGLRKAAVGTAYDVQQAADLAGRTTIANCQLRLRKVLGNRWSAAWEPTGFPNQSTAIPNSQDGRFTLLAALQNYFTAMPASESAEGDATAALCLAGWTAISNARAAVGADETGQTDAGTARDHAVAGLRRRVRGLINEMEQVLPGDDARWESFGLNIPANPTAPGPVPGFTATPLGGGKLEIELQYTPRATRVRLESKITGVDDDYVSKGSFKDLNFVIKGYTAGQNVSLRAIAGNDGGDAPAGGVVAVVVS